MNLWKLKRYKYAFKTLWQAFRFRVKIFTREFFHSML